MFEIITIRIKFYYEIFVWDDPIPTGQLTRANYEAHMSKYRGIFNHHNFHHFLGFANGREDIIGPLLVRFTKLFKDRIDDSIEITDLRLRYL